MAWLYHNQGLTQNEVAERLGISRATVVRMLDEALKRNEVQVFVSEAVDECLDLATRIEARFGITQVLVAPTGEGGSNPTDAVGSLLGRYLSAEIQDGMTVGIGWGRTLKRSLRNFPPKRLTNARVVSLMGGIVNPGRDNPVEVSWRLAGLMDAECFLYLAPVFVDSAETKSILLEKCDLGAITRLAGNLDMAIVSCGEVVRDSTSLSQEITGDEGFGALVDAGAVSDVMCNFIDESGKSVNHPLADRVMSIDLDRVATAKNVVLATGGKHRALALLASIRRLQPKTLITDEAAALELLELTKRET